MIISMPMLLSANPIGSVADHAAMNISAVAHTYNCGVRSIERMAEPVLIITGPPGVGKTATARALTEGSERAVHLEADRFFNFIRAGYVEPWKPDGRAIARRRRPDDRRGDGSPPLTSLRTATTRRSGS